MTERLPERTASEGGERNRSVECADFCFHGTEQPARRRADYDGDHPSRKSEREPLVREVCDENDRHGDECDRGLGENFESEVHRNEGDRDTSQSREQRRARRHLADGLRDERAENLDHSVQEAGDQSDLPCPNRIFGLLDDRQHDEKNESEQAHGIDSVGQCGDIVATRLQRLPALSLPLLQSTNELPIGVQLVGPRRGDARLLRTARWLAAKMAGGNG